MHPGWPEGAGGHIRAGTQMRVTCGQRLESRSPSEGAPVTHDKPEIDPPDGPPPTDLEVTELRAGEGDEAVAGRTVQVHYVGVAHSSGEEFDASYNRGEPLSFRLGVGQVIPG